MIWLLLLVPLVLVVVFISPDGYPEIKTPWRAWAQYFKDCPLFKKDGE